MSYQAPLHHRALQGKRRKTLLLVWQVGMDMCLGMQCTFCLCSSLFPTGFFRTEVLMAMAGMKISRFFFSFWHMIFANSRSGWPLERGSNVTAVLQAGRLPPINVGRPDADSAPLYICAYPVSSCWLFEQCSKFNPHPYVHSVRPEFGDHDIAHSNSPKFLYSDNIPIVTALPLTESVYTFTLMTYSFLVRHTRSTYPMSELYFRGLEKISFMPTRRSPSSCPACCSP